MWQQIATFYYMIGILKKIKFKEWIPVGALVLSIIVFCRDCSQDKKINDLEYVNKSMQYRPILEVDGSPRITSFDILTNKVPIADLIDMQKDSIRDVESTLKIYAKINVVNKGNAIAYVLGIIWCDTSSGIDRIRTSLLDENLRKMFVESPDSDYYQNTDISPGDTCEFNISHSIRFISEEKFTMHFLLLYQNEANSLFDTYYWARYITKPILYKAEFAIIDGNLACRFIYEKGQFKECLKLYDYHISSHLYSKKQSRDIIKYMTSHHKKDNL